jgi:hypothetical protein
MMLGPGTLGELQLAQKDGTSRIQLAHHGCILGGTKFFIDRRAGGRRYALCPAQIFHPDRNAVQRATDLATHDLSLGGAGLKQRCFGHHVRVALELAVQSLDARKLVCCRLQRRDLAFVNTAGEFGEFEIVEV